MKERDGREWRSAGPVCLRTLKGTLITFTKMTAHSTRMLMFINTYGGATAVYSGHCAAETLSAQCSSNSPSNEQ